MRSEDGLRHALSGDGLANYSCVGCDWRYAHVGYGEPDEVAAKRFAMAHVEPPMPVGGREGPKGGYLIAGSRCPRCYSPVEYDGNYWCSQCRWVLPEFPKGADLAAFNVAYVLYMTQTGREPDPKVVYP